MKQKPQTAEWPVFADYDRLSAGCRIAMQQFRTGEMVHAYLLTGARGLGKRTFARVLASTLFCMSEHKPCGVCDACRRVWDWNDPDVITLFADDGKQIKVDEVREVIRQVGQHSFGTGHRVVLIEPVEKLTPGAQNCLLKTLEEPLSNVVFILMTHELTATLGTIASRCVRVKMQPWPDALLGDTLEKLGYDRAKIPMALGLSGGNIGMAIECLEDSAGDEESRSFAAKVLASKSDADILALSTALKDGKGDAEQYLTALETAFHQALMMKAGLLPEEALSRYPKGWVDSLSHVDEAALNRLLEAVFLARRRRAGQVNWQSTLDQLMMTILEEQKSWQRS